MRIRGDTLVAPGHAGVAMMRCLDISQHLFIVGICRQKARSPIAFIDDSMGFLSRCEIGPAMETKVFNKLGKKRACQSRPTKGCALPPVDSLRAIRECIEGFSLAAPKAGSNRQAHCLTARGGNSRNADTGLVSARIFQTLTRPHRGPMGRGRPATHLSSQAFDNQARRAAQPSSVSTSLPLPAVPAQCSEVRPIEQCDMSERRACGLTGSPATATATHLRPMP